ncbi:MAG: ABC transporter ATP-binding protein [Oscillospiraceae bacterium]|nr:ABC transporter ATP-binding protein [Oscillospiraceae bacterium]MBR0450611.1 ABC transporter ATP-binding protein [Oscillospiraceae bacterium]
MNNAIEVRGLCKSYPGFKLDNLNITLPSGYILGFVGENGAGKSTTIRLLLDLIRRDSGEISVLGNDPAQADASWKNDVGVVLDSMGLPSLMKADMIGKVMADAFTRWDNEKFNYYLDRFDVPRDKRFMDMSNGTKMKLGIAIALSHDPKLLILDEATNGLDPLVRDDVNEVLMEFTREDNHSIFISSHIVSDLEKICDYIAFLHKGKLMLCEEKDKLSSEYGILSCSADDLKTIDPDAILHVSKNAYGCRAVVRRDSIPDGMTTDQITIEELFILMAKEEVQ